MFRVRLEAYETYRNATRPIILRSLVGVQETFDLKERVLTFFNGEAESTCMIGSDMSGKLHTNLETDVGWENRQFIEVEIDDAEANSELDSSHNAPTNTPLWYDPLTESMITPNYVTKKVDVTVNRYFKDRVTAYRFRDRINSRLKQFRIDSFSASVHYPVIGDVLNCMETIYDRLVAANQIDKTKENAWEWFTKRCIVPYDVITNVAGQNHCFVFKRSLDRIRLRFEGIDIAKSITKGKYYGQYLCNFRYSFYYDELKEWELNYPIMVYQQMTDQKYIPFDQQEQLNQFPSQMFYEMLIGYENGQYTSWRTPGMFIFPREDYGRLPYDHYLQQKLQRLVTLEDVDEQIVINLFKFGGEEKFWNNKFKYYISTHADKITTRHKCPFYVALWSDNIQVVDHQIELKENGDLILKRKPTMGAIYRVAFYFDYNIDMLDPDAKEEIASCAQEDMGRWILGVLYPFLPLPGDKEYYGKTKKGSCPWIDWNDDVEKKVDPGPGPNDRDGDKLGPPIYMMDLGIIAKNELLDQPEQYSLLDYTASQFYWRK